MVLFNYSTKELTAKIVYYGPGLCGKTTNLQYIFNNLPTHVHKGKMLSLATQTDRTLFFDFLPIELGTIRGMKTRLQLYTVPGQVFYNTTRKLVLKGADGVVFVADSQRKMLDANVESFRNLEENLKEHGMILAELPHILQFNKRDLDDLLTPEQLNSALNQYNAPIYEAVATTGIGVQDTLKAVTRLVLNSLREKYGEGGRKAAERKRVSAATATATASALPTAPAPSAPELPVAAVPEPVLEFDEGAASMASPDHLAAEPEVEAVLEPAGPGGDTEEPVLTLSDEDDEVAEAVPVEEPLTGAGEEVLEVAEEEYGEEPSPLQVEDVSLTEEAPPAAPASMEAIPVPEVDLEELPAGELLDVQPAGPPETSHEPDAASAETVAATVIGVAARPGSTQNATVPLSLNVKGETVRLSVTITIKVDES